MGPVGVDELVGRLLGMDQVEPSSVLLTLAAILARVGAAVWIAPFLGGRLVPAAVRVGVALALGLIMLPQLLPNAPPAVSPILGLAIVTKEALVGAALGFVVGLVFWAAEAAGRLSDTVRGATLAEALIPQTGARSSPLGDLFFQLTVVLFIVLGGHRVFITALAASYEVLPLAAFPQAQGLHGFALLCGRLTADLLLLALALAAPVVAALFLADLTLGLINRFAPQINVFFLAMPAKALLGIGAVVLSVGLLLGAMPPLLDRAVRAVSKGIELLGGG